MRRPRRCTSKCWTADVGSWASSTRTLWRAWMPWRACTGDKASTLKPSPSGRRSWNSNAAFQFIHLLEIMRRVLGEEHLETMITAGNLGFVYYRQGRYAETEAVFR